MNTENSVGSESKYRGLQPFGRGKSGNPGGVPKWLKKVRKKLSVHADEAIETLVQVMREGEAADRVRAAKVVLEYTVPKPTQNVDVSVKRTVARLKPEIAARLAALDS